MERDVLEELKTLRALYPQMAGISAAISEIELLAEERDAAIAERDKERARADRASVLRAEIWEALGGRVASDPLEPMTDGAARVRRELDAAIAERDAMRAVLTTPEGYRGVVADAVADELERLTAERDRLVADFVFAVVAAANAAERFGYDSCNQYVGHTYDVGDGSGPDMDVPSAIHSALTERFGQDAVTAARARLPAPYDGAALCAALRGEVSDV